MKKIGSALARVIGSVFLLLIGLFFAFFIYQSPLPVLIKIFLVPFFPMGMLLLISTLLGHENKGIIVSMFCFWMIAGIFVTHLYGAIVLAPIQFTVGSSLIVGLITSKCVDYYKLKKLGELLKNKNIIMVSCLLAGFGVALAWSSHVLIQERNFVLYAIATFFLVGVGIMRPNSRTTQVCFGGGLFAGTILTAIVLKEDLSEWVLVILLVGIAIAQAVFSGITSNVWQKKRKKKN